MPDDKLQPTGEPLSLEEVEELSQITQQEIAQAVATANPRLKQYLSAEADGR